jgi:hypothetical protein
MKRRRYVDKSGIKTGRNHIACFSKTDAIKDPPITQRKTDALRVDICIDRTFRISYEGQAYFINDIHIVLRPCRQ